MKIVLGYDDSEQSQDALVLAGRLAPHSDGTLVAAYIYHQEGPYESQDRSYRRALRDETHDKLGPVRSGLPQGVEVLTGAFPSSTPASGLGEVAEAEHANLIVIGSAHRGLVGRVVIGSVGEALCAGSKAAVAVAPHGYRSQGSQAIETIGAAFDGSPESQVAVVDAHRLATMLGAGLRVVSVLEPRSRFTAGSGGKQRRARATLIEQLAGTLDKLAPAANLEHVILTGTPTDELIATSGGTQLFVVGSRGHGPAQQVLLGSVSGKLMRLASCPVMVVPRGVAALAPEHKLAGLN